MRPLPLASERGRFPGSNTPCAHSLFVPGPCPRGAPADPSRVVIAVTAARLRSRWQCAEHALELDSAFCPPCPALCSSLPACAACQGCPLQCRSRTHWQAPWPVTARRLPSQTARKRSATHRAMYVTNTSPARQFAPIPNPNLTHLVSPTSRGPPALAGCGGAAMPLLSFHPSPRHAINVCLHFLCLPAARRSAPF